MEEHVLEGFGHSMCLRIQCHARIPNKCHASSDSKQRQKTAPWARILELKSKKNRHIYDSTDL
jgi:hypothetical protein